MIDSTNQVLHMFATAPSSGTGCPGSGTPGTIYEKTTPLSQLSFPAGRGTPVIRDAASAEMNNVTGTKQNITSTTGMIVLASNDVTQQYWHADVPLAGAPLTVGFTASPASGTVPLAVSFTDTSTGGVTAWSWNFGDGGTSTAQSPTHTYTAAGTYTVTLTGRTAAGASASSSRTVQVNSATSGSAVGFGGSTSTGQAAAGTSVTLTTPAGTVAGDVLVASFTADNSPTATAPAGWTALTTLRPSGASIFAYYHVVTAADAGTGSWTWTLDSPQKWSGGVSRYLNVNTSQPLDSSVTTSTSSGAVSSLNVQAITTATAGAMLVGGMGADSGKVTATPPSGWTEPWENALGQLAESGYLSTTKVGSQGATTWTLDRAMPSAAWTVALRPKAG